MGTPTSVHAPHPPDPHSLGQALAPQLAEACGGRLGPISWFRSVWQHGGAATGFAEWRDDSGRPMPVMVKLPVGSVEYRWTTSLGRPEQGGDSECPTPRVLACGESVGGYDLAWLVIERLTGHPLSHGMTEQSVLDLLHAAADFHEAARRVRPVDSPPATPDWAALLDKARELTRKGAMPEPQRWNEAVKRVQKALGVLQRRWAARPITEWCHGDLHPGNALRRPVGTSAAAVARNGCVLVDLALVHAGHWVEDAVYLERLYWGKPDELHGVKPVTALARLRRERGLHGDDGYADLAMVRRVLMAACVPVYADREGHHKYTHAALEIIEHGLSQVAH